MAPPQKGVRPPEMPQPPKGDKATTVPMEVHLKLQGEYESEKQRAAQAEASYAKAVRIIDRMKAQIGQVNASLAEAEENVAERQSQIEQLGAALSAAMTKNRESK